MRRCCAAGRPSRSQPTPFNLLCALARQPGALFTKDALLDTVWGHRFVSESVLKTAVSDLRTALGDQPREPRFIQTVPRRGYRFLAMPASEGAQVQSRATPITAAAPSESPSFIGRIDAVARLRQAWSQTCSGRRAVVWVVGEPGIGKTTLIEHFVAGLGNVAVGRGQCVEHYGSGEPYLPVLEALAELCRRDADLHALLRTVAPTWMLQLPWLGTTEERDALRRELAGVGPDRMLREMGELLERYTEQRPLLLVTEDLHWSDRATIQLIDHVTRRRGRSALMWLATFRVAEVVATDHPLNPLRRELRLHRLCEEIVLDPFLRDRGRRVHRTALAAARARRGLRPCSARAHRRRAAVRLVGHHRRDGAHRRRRDGQTRLAAVAVPENLAAIIDHYIDRLGSEQRSLLGGRLGLRRRVPGRHAGAGPGA
jgi:DNA-binding winged helix-turn-helix (wHTH) protein